MDHHHFDEHDRKRKSPHKAASRFPPGVDDDFGDDSLFANQGFEADEGRTSPATGSRTVTTRTIGPGGEVTVKRETFVSGFPGLSSGGGSTRAPPPGWRSGPSTGDRGGTSPAGGRGHPSRGRGYLTSGPPLWDTSRPSFGGSRDPPRPIPDRQPSYAGGVRRGRGGATIPPFGRPTSPRKTSPEPQSPKPFRADPAPKPMPAVNPYLGKQPTQGSRTPTRPISVREPDDDRSDRFAREHGTQPVSDPQPRPGLVSKPAPASAVGSATAPEPNPEPTPVLKSDTTTTESTPTPKPDTTVEDSTPALKPDTAGGYPTPAFNPEITTKDTTPAPTSGSVTSSNPPPGLVAGVDTTPVPAIEPAVTPGVDSDLMPAPSVPVPSEPTGTPVQSSAGPVNLGTGASQETTIQPDPTTGVTISGSVGAVPPDSTGATPSGSTGAVPSGSTDAVSPGNIGVAPIESTGAVSSENPDTFSSGSIGTVPSGNTGGAPSGISSAVPTGGSSAATGSGRGPAPIAQPAPQPTPGPVQPSVPEKLYMLAADDAHTSVPDSSVQPESTVFVNENSPSQVLLRSGGPMLFEAALDPATTAETYYELSTADSMRKNFDTSCQITKADKTSASFLKSISVSLESDAQTSLFRISDVKVQLCLDDTSDALVFTTSASIVNNEFETGFPAREPVVTAAMLDTPATTKLLAAPAGNTGQDSPATTLQTDVTGETSQPDAASSATAESSTAPIAQTSAESAAIPSTSGDQKAATSSSGEVLPSAVASVSETGTVPGGQSLTAPVKAPVDVTTLSGIDRYPGNVLLGLQAGRESGGGFQTLSDFCALAGLSTKPWLDKLLKFTEVRLGGLGGTSARNVMWYLPESSSMCCLRLEGLVDLDDNIKGYVGKYLGSLPEIKQLRAVAKRSVLPSADAGTVSEVMGELTLGVELNIVEDHDLGFYVSIKEDEITLMLVCYSTKLQWAWLKEWLLKNCNEVQGALEKLHGVLGSFPSSDKEPDPAGQHDHIRWRKLSVTLSSEKEQTVVKEIFVELEASLSFLVPKDKNAVFRLAFLWNKSDSEFTGMCSFVGDWSGQNGKTLPIQYLVGYERWVNLAPLVPTENYMSLRYIDGIEAEHIPYGLPTEIIRAELDISNKRLSFAGEMRSIIKPDTSTAVTSASENPTLEIDNVDFVIEMDIDYSESTKRVDATLAGSISLLPFRPGDSAAVLDAEVAYHSAQGEWEFHLGVSHLRMTALHSLFPHGTEKDNAMAILDSIELENIFLSYKHIKGAASEIQFVAIVDIADIVLSTNFKRDSPTAWDFSASLQQSQSVLGNATQKKLTIGTAIQKLLGQDVADVIPDFIKGTELVFSDPAKDKLAFTCKRLENPQYLVFGAELSFGMFSIDFAQVAEISEKDSHAAADAKEGDTPSKPAVKRLIRVSLSPLPSVPALPLIGNLDIPCDTLEFIWVSATLSEQDIKVLNTEVEPFNKSKVDLAGDDKELLKGCHFRLVGSEGVLIDYLFEHKPKAAPKKDDEAANAESKDEKPAEAPAGDASKEAADEPGEGGPGVTAPLANKKNGIKLSGVGLNYSGGQLKIHLDASLLVGPIGADVQGLNLIMDLSKVQGLHDLLHVPIKVQIDGFDISFDRSPVMLAGALHHVPDSKTYYGGIAISLSKLSVAAFGMYDQVAAQTSPVPSPEYDSFFVYGMLEGLLFTVGWAEFRGIIAGFGYNSRLRLPAIEELSSFPFLQGFGSPGGFKIDEVLDNLCGKDGYITPSMGSLWMAAGLIIRACEAIDMRAVATLAMGPNQLDIGLMARATATLPRGSEPSKALILIDLSVLGKLDLVHGELSVDGLINPTSFILNQNCRPSGGFAIRSWFGSEHKGDWVVSFGGYHPSFQVPAHYPIPPRLKIAWTLSDNLRITGEAYAAITPGALMAGGMLQAVFSAGALGAHFDAHADFLVNLKPLHYRADMAVFAGVSYEIRVWVIRKKISVEIGASLTLEGPPVNGSVHFDLSVVSFTVNFGSGSVEGARAISLQELVELVLQESYKNKTANGAIENPHVFSVIKGLVPSDVKKGSNPSSPDSKQAGKEAWVVSCDSFHFQVRSPIPVRSLEIQHSSDVGDGGANSDKRSFTGNDIISRPMHMKAGGETIASDLKIGVYHMDAGRDKTNPIPFRSVESVKDYLPSNYWGAYSENVSDYLRPGSSAPSTEHLVGLSLIPPPPSKGSQTLNITKEVETWPETPKAWRPAAPSAKATRYVDDNEARESVKWSRVRNTMKTADVMEMAEVPAPVVATTVSTTASQETSTQLAGPRKKDKILRQDVLRNFIALAHPGKDAQSKAVQNAYHRIGAAVPRVVLREPDRFYQSPPTVFCN